MSSKVGRMQEKHALFNALRPICTCGHAVAVVRPVVSVARPANRRESGSARRGSGG
jgi:hypothetical protein